MTRAALTLALLVPGLALGQPGGSSTGEAHNGVVTELELITVLIGVTAFGLGWIAGQQR